MGRDTKKYNRYSDDFVVDKIALSSVMDSIGGLVEIIVSHDIDLVDDREAKFELEMEDSHEQE